VATAPVRRLVSNIYYVRDDFTLMRSEFLNGAHQAAQPLIEGIEAMRVEYGIDNYWSKRCAGELYGRSQSWRRRARCFHLLRTL
jgi:hypothetical protein